MLCSALEDTAHNQYSIYCTIYSPKREFPVTTVDYIYADSITSNS